MNRTRVLALCAALAAGSVAARAAADPKKGQSVFEGNNCATCHNTTSPDKKMGPSLKGLYKKDKLANGKKPSDATVKARIDEGGGGMPGYKEILSDSEKTNLLAYLKTL
jgi:cytochrome c